MPHTGLLVRNERLSIELGHLFPNSNVNEIILQLGSPQSQIPGLRDQAVWACPILAPRKV